MTHAQPAGWPSQISRPALRSPAPSGGKGKIARPAANLPRLAVEIAGPCLARVSARTRSGRENEPTRALQAFFLLAAAAPNSASMLECDYGS